MSAGSPRLLPGWERTAAPEAAPSGAAPQGPPGSASPPRGGGAAAPAPHGGGRAGPGGAWPGGEARRGIPLEAARSPCGSPPAQQERRPCPARREDAENGGCGTAGSGRVRGAGRAGPGGSSGRERWGARRSCGERSLPPAPPSCAGSEPRPDRARSVAGPRGLVAAGPPLRPKMSGGARRRRRPARGERSGARPPSLVGAGGCHGRLVRCPAGTSWGFHNLQLLTLGCQGTLSQLDSRHFLAKEVLVL